MLHLLQFFFAPVGQPWYAGAVWGNVVAVVPCGLLGFIWAKTKFWPLNILHEKLESLHQKHQEVLDSHAEILCRLDELHEKHDNLTEALAGGSGPETSNLGG